MNSSKQHTKMNQTNAYTIHKAHNKEQIAKCQPVIQQLMPNITSPQLLTDYLHRNPHYHMVYLEENQSGKVMTVGGYLFFESLSEKKGHYVYLFDLVSNQLYRSKGYGRIMLQYITNIAKRYQCSQVELDSGTPRIHAHRFYFGQGMVVTEFHFKYDMKEFKSTNHRPNQDIVHVTTADQISQCVPLLQIVHPNITEKRVVEYVTRYKDYKLIALKSGNQVVALAGYRLLEGMGRGKYMQITEIATSLAQTSQGYGKEIINELKRIASAEGCLRIDLDVGTQNFRVHKFLITNDIILQGFHFHTRL